MTTHTQHTQADLVQIAQNRVHAAYYAALKADNDWQAALQSRYGKRAGDMRYTKEGQSGPFAELVAEWHRKRDAWMAAIEARKATGQEVAK